MLASEFENKEVFAAGMKIIGVVEDLMINPEGYALTDLVVKLQKDPSRRIFGKRFAFGGTKVRIPVSTVDKIGDSIVLRHSVDQLQEYIQEI